MDMFFKEKNNYFKCLSEKQMYIHFVDATRAGARRAVSWWDHHCLPKANKWIKMSHVDFGLESDALSLVRACSGWQSIPSWCVPLPGRPFGPACPYSGVL
jgi:hypothetical protein